MEPAAEPSASSAPREAEVASAAVEAVSAVPAELSEKAKLAQSLFGGGGADEPAAAGIRSTAQARRWTRVSSLVPSCTAQNLTRSGRRVKIKIDPRKLQRACRAAGVDRGVCVCVCVLDTYATWLCVW